MVYDLVKQSRKRRSCKSWIEFYEKAVVDSDVVQAARALNRAAVCVRNAVGLEAEVSLSPEDVLVLESVAKTSALSDVTDAIFALVGGRLLTETRALLRYAEPEQVSKHPDFVNLYEEGAAMRREVWQLFREFGVALKPSRDVRT
jgi:hypothetical protein